MDSQGAHLNVADMSGAITNEDYAASDSGAPIASGVLESLYNKDMTNEDAKEVAKKGVLAAMERDPGSGNGVVVLIIPNLLAIHQVRL